MQTQWKHHAQVGGSRLGLPIVLPQRRMQAVVRECNPLLVSPWLRGSNLRMIVMPHGRVQRIVPPVSISIIAPQVGPMMGMAIAHQLVLASVCHHINSA